MIVYYMIVYYMIVYYMLIYISIHYWTYDVVHKTGNSFLNELIDKSEEWDLIHSLGYDMSLTE